MRFSSCSTRIAGLAFGLALVAATGCGGSTGKLSGKVTYQNNPLKGGTVTLVPVAEGGKTFSTTIKEDGTYSLEKVEAGKYKVCVETDSLKPAPAVLLNPANPTKGKKNEPPPGATPPEGYRTTNPGAPNEQTKRFVAIPPDYGVPEKTSLTVEVKGGDQQHDIPLS